MSEFIAVRAGAAPVRIPAAQKARYQRAGWLIKEAPAPMVSVELSWPEGHGHVAMDPTVTVPVTGTIEDLVAWVDEPVPPTIGQEPAAGAQLALRAGQQPRAARRAPGSREGR